jgi:hypothetical protein
MAPPLHADMGYLGPKIGGKLEIVTKKKGRQVGRSLKKRSTDVSFPKKGRQLFVAVKMAPPPPFVNF